jgi:hypothetical protein
LLVGGIEAVPVEAWVIHGEHQDRPACERETIQQSGITATKFVPYGPKPDQDFLRTLFDHFLEKIDMLQSIIAAGTQNNVLGPFHLSDLRSENIGASRPIDRAFDDRMVRQQDLELARNVGLA